MPLLLHQIMACSCLCRLQHAACIDIPQAAADLHGTPILLLLLLLERRKSYTSSANTDPKA
jgi:hypothetical protein